jgi:hypothetical protein
MLGRSFIERQFSRGTKAAGEFAKAVLPAKELKVSLLENAIEGVTGIPPVIDKSDPKTTWVKLVKGHGDFADAILFKSVKKVKAGAARGQPADVKLDVKAAVMPIVWKRVVPAAAALFFLGVLAGRMSK